MASLNLYQFVVDLLFRSSLIVVVLISVQLLWLIAGIVFLIKGTAIAGKLTGVTEIDKSQTLMFDSIGFFIFVVYGMISSFSQLISALYGMIFYEIKFQLSDNTFAYFNLTSIWSIIAGIIIIAIIVRKNKLADH